MLQDTDKKFIKNIGKGKLYSVLNRAMTQYYIIEEDGVELLSVESKAGEPERMISDYKKINGIK